MRRIRRTDADKPQVSGYLVRLKSGRSPVRSRPWPPDTRRSATVWRRRVPLATGCIRRNPPQDDLPLDYLKVPPNEPHVPDMRPIGADQKRLIRAWPRSAGDVVNGFGNETRRNCRDGGETRRDGSDGRLIVSCETAGRLATALAGLITQKSRVRILSPYHSCPATTVPATSGSGPRRRLQGGLPARFH